MLFLISGRDGSTGYSFLSDTKETGASYSFDFIGESEPDSGDPFSREGERGGEFEFMVAMETLRLCSCSTREPSAARNSSRINLASWSFGGTLITSIGQ
jgi:hypothetical protein